MSDVGRGYDRGGVTGQPTGGERHRGPHGGVAGYPRMLTDEGAGVRARRIGVVGAGVMGGEIAQVAAAAGLEVALRDVHAAGRWGLGRAR